MTRLFNHMCLRRRILAAIWAQNIILCLALLAFALR